MLSVYAQDHVAFSPCSNYSDSFSYISFPYAFPLHKDYGQDGADDDAECGVGAFVARSRGENAEFPE